MCFIFDELEKTEKMIFVSGPFRDRYSHSNAHNFLTQKSQNSPFQINVPQPAPFTFFLPFYEQS